MSRISHAPAARIPGGATNAAQAVAADWPDQAAIAQDPEAAPTAYRLSTLLKLVTESIDSQFRQPVWVQAEIVELKKVAAGHVYLDLIERDTNPSSPRAKVRANMWKDVARGLMHRFETATGMQLRVGMKVLIYARVTFSPVYGLALVVVDVDPTFTLGAMAAHIAAIKKRLNEEALFDRNRSLPQPMDLFRVAVIAPDGAAGLGDFKREADIFQHGGVIDFDYYRAVFQGDRASATITEAFFAAAKGTYDIVVLLRGGGGTADLQYLNDYAIARAICCSRVPVVVGVGHEKDKTILDEVACVSLGTPSKIIGFIAGILKKRVQQVRSDLATIETCSRAILGRHRDSLYRQFSDINVESNSVLSQRRIRSDRMMNFVRNTATRMLAKAREDSRERINSIENSSRDVVARQREQVRRAWTAVELGGRSLIAQRRRRSDNMLTHIRTGATQILTVYRDLPRERMSEIERISRSRLNDQRNRASKLMSSIRSDANDQMRTTKTQLTEHRNFVQRRSGELIASRRQAMDQTLTSIRRDAKRVTEEGRAKTEALFREIVAQRPEIPLSRGYAMAKNTDGKIVVNAAEATAQAELELVFFDGSIKVEVKT